MSEFFGMGGYGAFIWPVVGATLIGFAVLYGITAKSLKALEKEEGTQ